MMFARCDQCHTEHETVRYDPAPTGWLALTEGHEDELHFCGWTCLATYATQHSIDAVLGP